MSSNVTGVGDLKALSGLIDYMRPYQKLSLDEWNRALDDYFKQSETIAQEKLKNEADK